MIAHGVRSRDPEMANRTLAGDNWRIADGRDRPRAGARQRCAERRWRGAARSRSGSQVLERIAVEKENTLSREIDSLRDR